MSYIVTIALATLAGLLVQRLLIARAHRQGELSDAEGLSITDIAGIIPTMSVLLLAFIMVAAFDSYSTASDVAGDEANAVLSVTRAAAFMPDEQGVEIARDMSCYARAVQHLDWPAMANGKASNVPEYWGDAANRTIQRAHDESTEIAFHLIDLERERLEARQVRLAQSLPSVPQPMTALMVFSVVLSVFFLAMLTHVSIRSSVQVAALIGAAALLTGSLMLIQEMDSPYTGLTKLTPDAMHHTASEVVDELAEYSSRTPPACDKRGMPTQDGSFKPGLEPIV